MEYPFKDLLPLDEVLAREGYYKDWTHLDPEVFYSLTQISEYIKTKGYGVDVRLLIAQLAEHFGLKTTQVVDLANLLSTKHDALKDQFDVIIRDATSGADWGGEIVLARGGKATLGKRLIDTDAQLAQTNQRFDELITTNPAEGINVEEIIDARQGAISLGANIASLKTELNNNLFSLENKITNGNFNNDMDGWGNAHLFSVENNRATFLGSSSSGGMRQITNLNGLYYLSVDIEPSEDLDFAVYDGTNYVVPFDVYLPEEKNIVKGKNSFVFEANGSSLTLSIWANKGVGTKFGDVILLNINEVFGDKNIPTKEEIDDMIKGIPSGYIDGKYALPQRELFSLLRQDPIEGNNLSVKHRALYIPDPVQDVNYKPVQDLLGHGILVEVTNFDQFSKNIDEWVNEFDILLFNNTSNHRLVLNHLSTTTPTEVYNALSKWRAAGKKTIVATNSNSFRLSKMDVNGEVESVVDLKNVMFLPLNVAENQVVQTSGNNQIIDTSNGMFGNDSLLDVNNFEAPDIGASVVFKDFGDSYTPIVSLSDGVKTEPLVIYNKDVGCVIGSGGLGTTEIKRPAYRYVNVGTIAKHLISGSSPIRFAEDCIHSKKIVASGIDGDVTTNKEAVNSILKAYNGRPVEFGVVASKMTKELAGFYGGKLNNVHINSHSTYHYFLGKGNLTETDEQHIIPQEQTVTLNYTTRVIIESVKINGITLTATSRFYDVLTPTQYGHDGHGNLRFNSSQIGETVTITYQRLDEAKEWLGSLPILEELGVLTNQSLYLTGGPSSITTKSVRLANDKGAIFCDHVTPNTRSAYLMEENTIPKMPPIMGTNIFNHWENLVRGGRSAQEIENIDCPNAILEQNKRTLPFVWYGHDFILDSDDSLSILNDTSLPADWRKGTNEETLDYAASSYKNFLDKVEAEGTHWMIRSDFCRRFDYLNRYFQYDIKSMDDKTIVYAKNTGGQLIKGVTFRSDEEINEVVAGGEILETTNHFGHSLFHFDLMAGETKIIEISYGT